MKFGLTRRQILNTGMAVGLGSLLTRLGYAEPGQPTAPQKNRPTTVKPKEAFSTYSQFHPSFGGPPSSDQFLGKLVPGFRKSGLEPVLIDTPDLGKVPWKMVNGVKEFELRCTPVKQEFLHGQVMNVWGFNESMPGPTVEVFQGDRVRFVVTTNSLNPPPCIGMASNFPFNTMAFPA